MTREEMMDVLAFAEGWLWAVEFERAADYIQLHANEMAKSYFRTTPESST